MYIVTKKYGRICNRLFNAAHVLASAVEHEHEFVNLAFYDYAHFFEISRQDIFCRYPAKKSFVQNQSWIGRIIYYLAYVLTSILRVPNYVGINFDYFKVIKASEYRDGCNLDATLLHKDLNGKKFILFQGFPLLGFNSLEKHGEKVREYFAPLKQYQDNINLLISGLRKDFDFLIGVVIRHGDYREWRNGEYFYTSKEYSEIMEGLLLHFPNKKIKFLICSDEEQNLDDFKNLDYFFRSGYMIENLYSLAKCDYIISPPSTFGMWASFYGKVPLYIINDLKTPVSIDSFKICNG